MIKIAVLLALVAVVIADVAPVAPVSVVEQAPGHNEAQVRSELAAKQREVNHRALKFGSGVGTYPYYGVPGTGDEGPKGYAPYGAYGYAPYGAYPYARGYYGYGGYAPYYGGHYGGYPAFY